LQLRLERTSRTFFDYIAKDNPNVARRVVLAIEQATSRLGRFPFSGRIGVVESTRELVMPRLPFIIVYRVTDATVDIIGVFHAAQDRPRGGF
jgi:toxin ParE1/3/4